MEGKNDSEKLVLAISELFKDIETPSLKKEKDKIEKQKKLILNTPKDKNQNK